MNWTTTIISISFVFFSSSSLCACFRLLSLDFDFFARNLEFISSRRTRSESISTMPWRTNTRHDQNYVRVFVMGFQTKPSIHPFSRLFFRSVLYHFHCTLRALGHRPIYLTDEINYKSPVRWCIQKFHCSYRRRFSFSQNKLREIFWKIEKVESLKSL